MRKIFAVALLLMLCTACTYTVKEVVPIETSTTAAETEVPVEEAQFPTIEDGETMPPTAEGEEAPFPTIEEGEVIPPTEEETTPPTVEVEEETVTPTTEEVFQPSMKVGNYYFLDIEDGFEFCVPGPASYDLLQVFHYNSDDTLRELDYVIIPYEDFDKSILEGQEYIETADGHFVFPYTSGAKFESASENTRSEARYNAWILWDTTINN